MRFCTTTLLVLVATTLLTEAATSEDKKVEADVKKRPGGSGGSTSLGGQNLLSSLSGGGLLSSLGGQGILGSLGGQGILGSLGGQGIFGSLGGNGILGSLGGQGLLSSFAHSRLNEVMSTATGVLAAIGGGYLLYVATVALYGNVLGRPYGIRRESPNDLLRQVKSLDYPEAVFNWLQIKDESCRMKAVCELQAFLSGNIPSVVLEGVSKKIPGMQKYLAASRRGLRKQNCNTQCKLSTGEMMMKAMGSWFHFT